MDSKSKARILVAAGYGCGSDCHCIGSLATTFSDIQVEMLAHMVTKKNAKTAETILAAQKSATGQPDPSMATMTGMPGINDIIGALALADILAGRNPFGDQDESLFGGSDDNFPFGQSRRSRRRERAPDRENDGHDHQHEAHGHDHDHTHGEHDHAA